MAARGVSREHVQMMLDSRIGEVLQEQRAHGERLAALSEDVHLLVGTVSGGGSSEGLSTTVLRHGAMLERAALSLEKLEHAVLGNGQAGVLERLRILEARAAASSRLSWIAIGAVVTALVGAVVAIVLR